MYIIHDSLFTQILIFNWIIRAYLRSVVATLMSHKAWFRYYRRTDTTPYSWWKTINTEIIFWNVAYLTHVHIFLVTIYTILDFQINVPPETNANKYYFCFDSRAKITLKPVKKLKFSKLVMVPPRNKAVRPGKSFEN